MTSAAVGGALVFAASAVLVFLQELPAAPPPPRTPRCRACARPSTPPPARR
ncbi:hypothetical protein ACFQ1I_21635 [Kitasatospora arboriphila]